MAKINFPANRGQCDPVIGAQGNTDPLQNGDKTNITVDSSDGNNHNVTITYMYVKPAAPNTDSWWKSMGRTYSITPKNKIEQLNSSVEVLDSGTNGQVVVTTDGTERAKFRTDGHLAIGGNLDASPNIDLNDDGTIIADGAASRHQLGRKTDVATNSVLKINSKDGDGTNNKDRFIIDKAGNVFIGDLTEVGNGSPTGTTIRLAAANGDVVAQGNIISGPAAGDYVSTKELRSRDNSNESAIIFTTRNVLGNPTTQAGLKSGGSPAFCIGGTLAGAGNTWTPNITLNANGSGTFKNIVQSDGTGRGTGNVYTISSLNNDGTNGFLVNTSGLTWARGGSQVGGTGVNSANITLNADGTAVFTQRIDSGEFNVNDSKGRVQAFCGTDTTAADWQAFVGFYGGASRSMIKADGTLYLSDVNAATTPKVTLNSNGTASFVSGRVSLDDTTNDAGLISLQLDDATPAADEVLGRIQFGAKTLDNRVAGIDSTVGSSAWSGLSRPSELRFYTRGQANGAALTEQLRINAAGKLVLTRSGSVPGIQFGYSDGSGDITSQTLDDYEEGSWTPASSNGNVTISGIVSRYTKVGNLVAMGVTFNVSATSGTAAFGISLPFTVANIPGTVWIGDVDIQNAATDIANVTCSVAGNATNLSFRFGANNGLHSDLAADDLTASTTIRASIEYQAV